MPPPLPDFAPKPPAESRRGSSPSTAMPSSTRQSPLHHSAIAVAVAHGSRGACARLPSDPVRAILLRSVSRRHAGARQQRWIPRRPASSVFQLYGSPLRGVSIASRADAADVSHVVDPIRSRCYKKLLCAAGSAAFVHGTRGDSFPTRPNSALLLLCSCWWKRVRNTGNLSLS